MTAAAIPAAPAPAGNDTRLVRFFRDAGRGSAQLTLNAGLMFTGFVAAVVLMQIDTRTFLGADVWHKPAKFFFSLAVQFITVAWAVSLLPEALRRARTITLPSLLMVIAGWGEMAYITFRAARAEASHYNLDTIFTKVAYGLMGLGALVLVLTAAWIGYVIWRNRDGLLWREAAGLGLMLSTVLTLPVAFYLSSNAGGHWVGGEASDANGLRLFLWSTTGGDLRIPHFVALHAMQGVPFAALSGSRGVVLVTALAFVLLTGALFAQAALGIPLFRL